LETVPTDTLARWATSRTLVTLIAPPFGVGHVVTIHRQGRHLLVKSRDTPL
jgi:hypothetical protein